MPRKKVYTLAIIFLMIVGVLLTLGLVKSETDNRSRAAAADKLEAEEGTLSGNAVSKPDSTASSGNFVELGVNQTSTSTPGAGKFPATLSLLPTISSYPFLPTRPAFQGSYKDTVYGGTIKRISSTSPTPSQGTMGYPTTSAFNSDDSLILITNNTRWLYDAKTYAYLGVLQGLSIPLWSNRLTSPGGPKKLWGMSDDDNVFRRLDVDTKVAEPWHTFTNYSQIRTGRTISQDDTITAFKGLKSNGEWWLILYNPVTDTVIAEKKLVHPVTQNNYEPKNVAVSKTGQYIVIGYGVGVPNAEWGTYFMRATDLSWISSIGTSQTWHADWCIDSQGRDAYVAQNGTMIIPVTAQTVDLFPNRAGKIIAAGHISCRGPDGWAYPSTNVAYQAIENYSGFDMIYRVKLDGSGQVQVWGFAHAISHPGEANYVADWSDPYANPSRSGSKIIFGSKWASPTTYPTEPHLYIMEMLE